MRIKTGDAWMLLPTGRYPGRASSLLRCRGQAKFDANAQDNCRHFGVRGLHHPNTILLDADRPAAS